MFKTLMLIVVGLCLGYFMGFSDGRVHRQNVVARMVDRVGGSHRDAVANDVDKQMDSVEGR